MSDWDFTLEEYAERLARLHTAMREADVAAMLIDDALTMNCARLEFALCWSSPLIPVRHSKTISPGRITCLISMSLRALA
jgi:hypothetical protein